MTYKTYRDLTHNAFLNIKCISNLDRCVYSLILCCEINCLPLHINLQSCMATLLFVFAYFVFDPMILWNRIKGFSQNIHDILWQPVPVCLPKTVFYCTLYRPSVFFNLQWTYLIGFQSALFAFIYFFIKNIVRLNLYLNFFTYFQILYIFILVSSCWAQR